MPKDTATYDLIVIGTGSGGAPAASKCAVDGWSVAIVDDQPYGGTCALRGCDPKKVLIGGAELVGRARRMQGHGVSGAFLLDWPELMRFKRTFTEDVPSGRERRFEEQGIDPYHGPARFIGEDRIEVEGQTLRFENLLLANGAKPAPLPFEGAEHLATSTDFLELDRLPGRIVFVGGGYISMEFAHLAARAGAEEVTVLHRGERLLEGFETDLVEVLTEHTRSSLGIDVRLGTPVTDVERRGEGVVVRAESEDGEEIRREADLAVHGAGRVPALGAMDLEAGGVEHSEADGVAVTEHLRSRSNPRVWAAGDAAATEGLPLTPVAAAESLTVASNLRAGSDPGRWRTPAYAGLPTVVFTGPPLASVGLTEAEAEKQGLDFATSGSEDITDWYSYKRLRSQAAGFKVLTGEETGEVLGAHVLGGSAGETINLFAQAMRHGIAASELRHGLYAYPTHASDLPHMV